MALFGENACSAWLNHDHIDNTIRDSYNVSSVTDLSTGEIKMNFATSMPNANYAAVSSCGQGATNIGDADIAGVCDFQTGSVEVQTIGTPDLPSTEADMEFLCVAIFADT